MQDSLGFWIPRRGFRNILCQWNLGFQIPIVSRILDSLRCIPDPKPRIPDSGFHKQIPEFWKLKLPDSGIGIPLHGGDKTTGIYKTRIAIVHVCILWNAFLSRTRCDLALQLSSLRKQPTFRVATIGKMTSQKRAQKFHTQLRDATILRSGRVATEISVSQSEALPRSGQ